MIRISLREGFFVGRTALAVVVLAIAVLAILTLLGISEVVSIFRSLLR